MKSSHWIVKALMALVLLWTGLALLAPKKSLWKEVSLKMRPKIAVIPVYGEISDPGYVVALLHRYRDEEPPVKAVVLAIDSPGGSVAASQEICEAIKDLQAADIPVVASMGNVAASGAYYISAPCDKIVADAGTLTGSIGVIMETYNAKKILDKVGVELQVVKSGEFKDAGNFNRPLTARERQLFQGIINDVYAQFVDVVATERKGPISTILAKKRHSAEDKIGDAEIKAWVKSFADGRVFSGRQAQDYGLVDELGGLDKAIDAAADLAGIDNPQVVTYREPKTLAEMLTGVSKADLKSWANEALRGEGRRFGLYAW